MVGKYNWGCNSNSNIIEAESQEANGNQTNKQSETYFHITLGSIIGLSHFAEIGILLFEVAGVKP